MREILFRGKRLDNGEWVTGRLIADDRDGKEFIVSWIGYHCEEDIDSANRYIECFGFEVDPETVGQLIRKGSESRFDIYAGDILQDDWGYKYVIEWDNEDMVYRAKSIITGELNPLHGKWAIGTEFDNPERLEVI